MRGISFTSFYMRRETREPIVRELSVFSAESRRKNSSTNGQTGVASQLFSLSCRSNPCRLRKLEGTSYGDRLANKPVLLLQVNPRRYPGPRLFNNALDWSFLLWRLRVRRAYWRATNADCGLFWESSQEGETGDAGGFGKAAAELPHSIWGCLSGCRDDSIMECHQGWRKHDGHG